MTLPPRWPSLWVALAISYGVAGIGGALTDIGPWYLALNRPDWVMAEWPFLWLSIALLIWGLWRISRPAALLNIPYIAWVSTTGLLNWENVVMNGP